MHIGARFGTDGRFRVIHKVGSGGMATVWLCRDQDTKKYVGLKIVIADKSHEDSRKLRLVNRGIHFRELVGDSIAIPREHFWHHGPNGKHLCLIFPILGPRVTALWSRFENPADVSRDIVLQVTRGLNFLHKNGIYHGGQFS